MADQDALTLADKIEQLRDDGSEGVPWTQDELDLMVKALRTLSNNAGSQRECQAGAEEGTTFPCPGAASPVEEVEAWFKEAAGESNAIFLEGAHQKALDLARRLEEAYEFAHRGPLGKAMEFFVLPWKERAEELQREVAELKRLEIIYVKRVGAAEQRVRELEKDAGRLKHLHDDPKRAQAYFWNHQGRKERNAAIDSAMLAAPSVDAKKGGGT